MSMTTIVAARRWMLAAVPAAVSALAAPQAQACSSEDYVGSICITAASFCPTNYLLAAGQSLSIRDYQMLFSLLGTTYGGDGMNTFSLPDMRGRTPVGTGNGTGLAVVALGQKRGSESAALSQAGISNTKEAPDVTSVATAQSIPTVPPQLGLTYCIAVNGAYPPR